MLACMLSLALIILVESLDVKNESDCDTMSRQLPGSITIDLDGLANALLSPDGSKVVVADSYAIFLPGEFLILDVASKSTIFRGSLDFGWKLWGMWSPDSEKLILSCTNMTVMWTSRSNTLIHVSNGDGIFTWRHDSKAVAVGALRAITIYEVNDNSTVIPVHHWLEPDCFFVSLAWSQEDYIAAACWTSIKIFDLTGRQVRALLLPIKDLEWSPHGKWLLGISTEMNNLTTIFFSDVGDESSEMRMHHTPIQKLMSAMWVRNGSLILTCDYGSKVELRYPGSGLVVLTIDEGAGMVAGVTTDFSRLAMYNGIGYLTWWNPTTNIVACTPLTLDTDLVVMSWLDPNRAVFSAGFGYTDRLTGIEEWDTESEKTTILPGVWSSFAACPQMTVGESLLAMSSHGNISILRNGKLVVNTTAPQLRDKIVRHMLWSRDCRILATSSTTSLFSRVSVLVWRWDDETHKLQLLPNAQWTIESIGQENSIALSWSGQYLTFIPIGETWDISQNPPAKTWQFSNVSCGGICMDGAWSATGMYFVVVGHRAFTIWQEGRQILQVAQQGVSPTWSAKEDILAMVNSGGSIVYWNPSNPTTFVTQSAPQLIHRLCWHPFTLHLLGAGYNRGLFLWDSPFVAMTKVRRDSNASHHVVGNPTSFTADVVGYTDQMKSHSQPGTVMVSWLDSSTLLTHCILVNGVLELARRPNSGSPNDNNNNKVQDPNDKSIGVVFRSSKFSLPSPGSYSVYLSDHFNQPWWIGPAPMAALCPANAIPVVDTNEELPQEDRQLSTCQCRPGFYGTGGNPPRVCKECPPHGLCNGSALVARPGYWQRPENQTLFLKCAPGACRGGAASTNCISGQTGPACGVCQNHFAQTGFGSCTPCPKYSLIILGVGGGAVLWTLFCTFQSLFAFGWTCSARSCRTRSYGAVQNDEIIVNLQTDENELEKIVTDNDDQGEGKARYYSSQIASIIMSTSQVNALLMQVNLGFVKRIRALFSLQEAAQGGAATLISFPCLLRAAGVAPSELHYAKMFLLILTPPIVLVFLLLLRLIRFRVSGTKPSQATVWIPTMIVWLSLQTTTATSLLQVLSCQAINSEGFEHRLKTDLEVPCYTSEHYQMIFFVVIPSLVIYFIIIPLVIWSHVRKPDANSVLRRLTSGYRHEAWFIVVLVRKLLLAFIVSRTTEAQYQLAWISICLMLAFLLQLTVRPSQVSMLNYAESLALASSTYIFIMSQALIGDDSDDQPFSNFMATLIILLSVLTYAILFGLLLWDRRRTTKNISTVDA